MKLKPDNWTHHHAHRLYHLSLGMCFSFAAVMILMGTTISWLQARAQSQTEIVAVTAEVPQVSPGPIITDNGGGPAPVPPPQTQTPPPSNNPTPPANSNNPSSQPSNNAVNPPSGFVPPASGGPTTSRTGYLSIILQISNHYKTVQPGQRVIANIQLANNNPQHKAGPLDVDYTIENSHHEIIVQVTDTMTLDKSLSFSKVFVVNPAAAPDIYTIIAQIGHDTDVATASDTFTVKVPSPLIPSPPSQTVFPWQEVILALLLTLFGLIAAIAYHHVAHATALLKHGSDLGKPVDNKKSPL